MLETDKIKDFREKTYTKQHNDFYTTEFKKLFNYYIKYEFRELILDEMVKHFSNDQEIFNQLYMNTDQLKIMHKNKMLLGSHSVSHFVFSKLKEEDQEQEIKKSFEFLEDLFGCLDIKVFCYPYGGFHTFTDFTEKTLSRLGCQFSFNVESRDVTFKDLRQRPQAIPRYV